MKNFTSKDIEQIQYGISLIMEETNIEIQSIKNKANNIKKLSSYKNYLSYLLKLSDKVKELGNTSF